MTRQESFEQHWADQHGVPADTMAQYRWAEQDGYRLPGIAAAYRNYCAGWDAGMKQTFVTVAPHVKQCLVCGDPAGHGGLSCPGMQPHCVSISGITPEVMLLNEKMYSIIKKGEDHEQ